MRYALLLVTLCISSAVCAQPNKELYELQVRCGEQAAQAFKNDYAPVVKTKDGQQLFNYENHFSSQLNRCFFLEISVTVEKGKSSTLYRLFDLNENKEYGSFFKISGGNEFSICVVQGVNCSSEEEFRKLAKPYLEN